MQHCFTYFLSFVCIYSIQHCFVYLCIYIYLEFLYIMFISFVEK